MTSAVNLVLKKRGQESLLLFLKSIKINTEFGWNSGVLLLLAL